MPWLPLIIRERFRKLPCCEYQASSIFYIFAMRNLVSICTPSSPALSIAPQFFTEDLLISKFVQFINLPTGIPIDVFSFTIHVKNLDKHHTLPVRYPIWLLHSFKSLNEFTTAMRNFLLILTQHHRMSLQRPPNLYSRLFLWNHLSTNPLSSSLSE